MRPGPVREIAAGPPGQPGPGVHVRQRHPRPVQPGPAVFHPRGSFWTNSTTELLAATSDRDRQARTRNRCHGEGYESVALVPLTSGNQALGLLQFNDRRRGKFTPAMIQLLERLADNLASGIARRQAEEALRESEERYRSLFENNHAVMLIVDPEAGVVVDANPAACTYYGYPRAGLVGRAVTSINTLDPEQITAGMQQAKDGRRQHFEFKHRLASGVTRDVEVFSGPITLAGRQLLYSIVHDITARKEAEAALHRSNQRLDLMAETAGGLLAAVAPQEVVDTLCRKVMEFLDCDVSLNYLVAPGQPELLLLNAYAGISEEEAQDLRSLQFGVPICGLAAREACPAVFENILHSDDPRTARKKAQGIQAYACHPLMVEGRVLGTLSFGSRRRAAFTPDDLALMKAVADQVAIAMDRKLAEESLRQSEEALRLAHHDLERQVEARTAALRHANQQLLLEINERARVQRELTDSEARFTAFMEHLSGLATMRDVEGRYLFANRAWEETVGLAPGAWQGKTMAEIWPPKQAAALTKLDQDIFSSGKPTEQVEKMELADGPHYYLTHRFPIHDADGLPYMAGTVAIDITAREQAERQVAETGRLYRVLSQVNEAILRARDQQSLFEQICRIAVEEGLFRLAWVGLTDPLDRVIRVAAKYGADDGYLDNLEIPVADGPQSQGPTGTAVREERYDICNDFATELRMAPWRQKALKRGFLSSGAFPLRIGDRVVGAITLYAPRTQFFTHQEITLMNSLADNLSFALTSLDLEAKRRQAEAALADHARLVHDLYNQAPCAYHSLDRDGTFVQVNDTELAWLGYTREEVVGRLKFADLLTPDSQKLFWESYPGTRKRGWVKDLEYDVVRKDGSVFPVLLSATTITGPAGEFVMTRSTMFDITERRQAEGEIRKQAALLELAHDAIIVRDMDSHVIFWSKGAEATYGFTKEQAQGQVTHSLLQTTFSVSQEEVNQQILQHNYWDGELRHTRADGSIITVTSRQALQKDENGIPLAILELNRDVTERRQAEEALAIERQRLLDLLEHLPAYIYLQAPDHTLRFANREFRQRFGDPNGKACYSLFWGKKEPCPECPTFAVFHTGQPLQWELATPDGRVYQVYDYPFADVDGSPLVLEMGVDITARKKAEESRGRLIEILEATPDFVGIADYHGKLQYLNRAGRAMVGIGADEDISRLKALDLHPREVRKLILKAGAPTAVREGVWQGTELTLRHRDGHEIPVSQVILAHKDETGRVQFFSTVARDISDVKEAQASILRHTAMVNGINRIFKEALISRTEEELGQTCLTVAEELTASPFGFIDKVDDKGNFAAVAVRYPGWVQGGLAPAAGFSHLGYINDVELLRRPVQEGVALAHECACRPSGAGHPRGPPAPDRLFGGAADLRGAGHRPFGPRQQGGGLQPGGPGSHGKSGPGHGGGPHAPPGRRSPEGLGKQAALPGRPAPHRPGKRAQAPGLGAARRAGPCAPGPETPPERGGEKNAAGAGGPEEGAPVTTGLHQRGDPGSAAPLSRLEPGGRGGPGADQGLARPDHRLCRPCPPDRVAGGTERPGGAFFPAGADHHLPNHSRSLDEYRKTR